MKNYYNRIEILKILKNILLRSKYRSVVNIAHGRKYSSMLKFIGNFHEDCQYQQKVKYWIWYFS